jgi:hypothetical protein
MTTTTIIPSGQISESVRYFLRIGCLGFGDLLPSWDR